MFMSCNKTEDCQEPGMRVWRDSVTALQQTLHSTSTFVLAYVINFESCCFSPPRSSQGTCVAFASRSGLGEIQQQGVVMWSTSRRVECMHSMDRRGGSTWLQQRARTCTWHRHLTRASSNRHEDDPPATESCLSNALPTAGLPDDPGLRRGLEGVH